MIAAFTGDGPEQLVIGFIIIVAVIVVGGIIFTVVKSLSEWSSNNDQPVLRVPAKIVARRTNLSVSSHHHHHEHHHAHTSTSTQYYATFELDNGERMEFQLDGREAGLLIEGDRGELTYQGTRYHGFDRLVGSVAGRKAGEPSAPLSGAVCVRCEKPLPAGHNDCPDCGWTQP